MATTVDKLALEIQALPDIEKLRLVEAILTDLVARKRRKIAACSPSHSRKKSVWRVLPLALRLQTQRAPAALLRAAVEIFSTVAFACSATDSFALARRADKRESA